MDRKRDKSEPGTSSDGDKQGSASPAEERRRFRRVALQLPGKVFVPSTGKEAPCEVRNISPSGTEMSCALERLLDTPIILYAAGLGRFEGHVVWEREGRYGVRFTVSELKQARLAERLTHLETNATSSPDARRGRRVAASGSAKFTREDGSVVDCVILDFSTSGVSVQTNVRPHVGEYVLMGGMVGRVARYHETGVGIEFVDRERDEAKLRAALEALDLWRTDEGESES